MSVLDSIIAALQWLGVTGGLEVAGGTVRFCGRCGGEHRGSCGLVRTSYGTLCRPGLRESLEAREADRRRS